MKKKIIELLKKNEHIKLFKKIGFLKNYHSQIKLNDQELSILKKYHKDYRMQLKKLLLNGIKDYEWINYDNLINLLNINIDTNKSKKLNITNNIRNIRNDIKNINKKIDFLKVLINNMKIKISKTNQSIKQQYLDDLLLIKYIHKGR